MRRELTESIHYLAQGLSVGQSMLVIVVGSLLVLLFSVVIAWCGLKVSVESIKTMSVFFIGAKADMSLF